MCFVLFACLLACLLCLFVLFVVCLFVCLLFVCLFRMWCVLVRANGSALIFQVSACMLWSCSCPAEVWQHSPRQLGDTSRRQAVAGRVFPHPSWTEKMCASHFGKGREGSIERCPSRSGPLALCSSRVKEFVPSRRGCFDPRRSQRSEAGVQRLHFDPCRSPRSEAGVQRQRF